MDMTLDSKAVLGFNLSFFEDETEVRSCAGSERDEAEKARLRDMDVLPLERSVPYNSSFATSVAFSNISKTLLLRFLCLFVAARRLVLRLDE